MIKVGIIGATGYTGEELIKILLSHAQVRITYLSAKIDKEQNIDEIFPYLKSRLDLKCENLDVQKAVKKADLLFLALPHTVSCKIAPLLLAHKKRVVDLSADYRLKDAELYEQWYKSRHADKDNIKKSIYGLPELYRQNIKNSDLIANPGCYPTAAILAIAPLIVSELIDAKNIIIDAKSGLTGAGRKASLDFFFSEINENCKPYKLNCHQHMPEIEQELSKLQTKKIAVSFCPHIVPMNRGIIETIYLKPSKKISKKEILKVYTRFFKTEPFVRIIEDGIPSIRNVVQSNFCDIGVQLDTKRDVLIVVSAIDNLVKGAAGQAVQNMNIMYGFPEVSGLL